MQEKVSAANVPRLSVVVTTYQRVQRLPRLLDRLLADPAAGEVVVVADACSDGTQGYLEQRALGDKRLRPLIQSENTGPWRARAAGVEHARHEHVLNLDDDVIPTGGLVSGHARHHADSSRRYVVLGYMPTIIPTPRRGGQFATVDYAIEYERHVSMWRADPSSIWGKFWAGNFSCARSDFLTAAEGMDFPVRYHEDAELGLRLRTQGAVPVFDEWLRGDHEHQRCSTKYLEEARNSALGQMELHQRWPHDRPFDPDRLRRESSRAVQMALSATARPFVFSHAVAALMGVARVAGLLHRWSVEERTAHLAAFLVMFDAISAGRRATGPLERSESPQRDG